MLVLVVVLRSYTISKANIVATSIRVSSFSIVKSVYTTKKLFFMTHIVRWLWKIVLEYHVVIIL